MEPTIREYLSIPGVVWLWMAFAVSASLFAYRLAFLVRAIRLGKSDDRSQHLGRRLRFFVKDVCFQPRLRGEMMWPVHLAIFWGFVVYAVTFVVTLVKGLVPSLPFPWPDEIGPVRFILEEWGTVVLIALATAAFRRFIVRPVALKQSRDAAVILALIGSLMITFLLGSGFQMMATNHPATFTRPIERMLSSWFQTAGLTTDVTSSLYLTMWWAHVVIVLGFLAYLPYSKHLHLLMAPFSVLLTDLKPKGALPQEEASATDAATFDLRDFTWRELLTPLACAECGRCDRSCPAFTSGASFSPQTLVHHMKEHILEAGPALLAEDGKNASECIESPEAGLALMDYLVGRDKAVIIDSLLMEPDEAGKVFEWDLNELGRPTAFSPHYVGLCEIRELARQLGLPFPDAVKVFGVAVRNPFTMGEPMSPEVEAALESVIERVHVVIQDWRRTLECH